VRGNKLGHVRQAVLLSVVVAQAACTSPQEKAREKLGQMNIKYDEETFLDRTKAGDLIVVTHFLTAGMSPKVTDKEGKTPLIVAARAGRLDVVQLLLDRGADVREKDKKFGATPLIWAALGDTDNKAVAELLLAKGADPKARERTGMTALLSALARNHQETARLLIEKGGEVNDKDKDGRTPLMWAAQSGAGPTVVLLLEKGADLKAREEKQGADAFLVAAARGRTEVVKLLLEKGTDPKSVDQDRKTALMWAARAGHADTVKFLLGLGADVKAKDAEGNTAMTLAKEGNKKEVEDMLLKAGAAPEKAAPARAK
jgi:ankyrin repeat protein